MREYLRHAPQLESLLILPHLNIQGSSKSLGRNTQPVRCPFDGQGMGSITSCPHAPALQATLFYLQISGKVECALGSLCRQPFHPQAAILPG